MMGARSASLDDGGTFSQFAFSVDGGTFSDFVTLDDGGT